MPDHRRSCSTLAAPVLAFARWLFFSLRQPQLSGGCRGSVGRPNASRPAGCLFSGSRRVLNLKALTIPAPFLPLRGISNCRFSIGQSSGSGGVLVGVHIRRTDHQQAVAPVTPMLLLQQCESVEQRTFYPLFAAPMIRQKLNLCASCSAIACFGTRLSALIAPVSCPQSML